MKVYSVLFKNSSKPYYFKSKEDFNIDDYVVVDTDKGEQLGKVVDVNSNPKDYDEYKLILRLATKEDENNYYDNLKDAIGAVECAKSLVSELKLNMYIINASYNLDRSQLLINFSADERIDFRELAKKLAGKFKTRIELRQIGARDKAKLIGGVGICGQKLCCSNFLDQIDSISMNKAKNQGLSLNPNKINGACGRLLCCLCYEDEEYSRCNKGLLQAGKHIKYHGEDAVITSVNILNRTYKISVNDEKIDVNADEIKNENNK